MKSLLKIDDSINKLVKFLLIVLTGVITVIIFMQIVYRYVLLRPIPWAEELARYIFVWISFLGSTVAVQKKSHVGVEFVISRLPVKVSKYVMTVAYLLCATFSLLMTVHGSTLVQRTASQVSAAMRMSMSAAYVAIPIGFVLMTKDFLINAYKELASIKSDDASEKTVDLRGE